MAKITVPLLRAVALGGIGQYGEAVEHAGTAVEEAIAQGMPRQRAEALVVRMECLAAHGSFEEASQDARVLAQGSIAETPGIVRAKALRYLASRARVQGDIQAARTAIDEALAMVEADGNPLDAALIMAERGRILQALGDGEGADKSLARACELALAIRKDAPEVYRRDFVDTMHGIFEERIRQLLSAGYGMAAYRLALKIIARSLAERFGLRGDEPVPDLVDAAQVVILPLGSSLAVFAQSPQGFLAWMVEASGLRFSRGIAERRTAESFRGFSLAPRQDTAGSEGRGMVKNEADPQGITSALLAFRTLVSEGDSMALDYGRELYRNLIGPAQAILEPWTEWRICAAGVAAAVPWDALVDADGRFLAARHELMHLKSPSLASVRGEKSSHGKNHGQKAPELPKQPVLAVGDPLDRSEAAVPAGTAWSPDKPAGLDPEKVTHPRLDALRFAPGIETSADAPEVPPLPGAAREAGIACSAVPGSVLLLGASATKRAFLDRLQSQSWSILHIAAHALYAESGEEGAILFHPDGDSILTTTEIQALTIDVETVVLSACASALGKPSWSEGAVGLVDAFLAAGARHVYATLWRMGDLRTATFMERVYADAQDGDFGSAFSKVRRSMATNATGSAATEALNVWASFVHYR